MSSFASAALDHVVINVRTQLDQAQHIFRRLGFYLTQRGHHSIGTVNYLAVFQNNYLELLGYAGPDGAPPTDLVDAPLGLRAIALQPHDSAAVEARLVAKGLLAESPADFSRPVAHAQGIDTARFRVLKVRGDGVTGGRIFYCHHYTPELVRRDEWRRHPNGATDVSAVFVCTPHPQEAAAAYAETTGGIVLNSGGEIYVEAGAARILFVSWERAVADLDLELPETESSRVTTDRIMGLRVKTASIQAAREVLSQSQVGFHALRDGSLLVDACDALGLVLIFAGPAD